MSDVDKLLERFERGELLRPDPELPNVVDLAHALTHLAGGDCDRLPAGARRLADLIGPAEHLVFVLADGLGMNVLEAMPDDLFLRSHLVAELRSVFPSTTATVLTTLATGAWPNQHGVTGQWTHLPQIQGAAAVLPFAARSGGRALTHLGLTVEEVFPLAPLLRLMSRDVLALFPSRLVNSVTSIYFSGSRARVGYETLPQSVDAICARVDTAEEPTYTYLYTPGIDSETHWMGTRHHGVRGVVNELNRLVERLTEGVRGRARVVVSADHGLLDASVSARHAIKPSDELFGALRFASSGDDRVLYLHVRPGAEERFRRRFKAQYGDRFYLIPVDEAEQHQLFGPGPIAPAVRERFGDFVVISSGVDVIEYVPTARVGRRVDLNAFHSGLSPDEMRVPLIVI